MNEDAKTGGWRRGPPRAAARSGTPESRPQLEELRSSEWVTEPAARGGLRRQDPPGSYRLRS
jgi:hypothetical protein